MSREKTNAWAMVLAAAAFVSPGCVRPAVPEGAGAPARLEDATTYPTREISNGALRLTVYLPDAERGYYRGTRFDWSGHVANAEFAGHTFFGVWKTPHDPFGHGDGAGTADEFGMHSPLGFDEVEEGGSFVKIGVGLLRKDASPEYKFSRRYELLRAGEWRLASSRSWIEFGQEFAGERGWAYSYLKRIELDSEKPSFTISRTLTNTGTKTIDTTHYCHNFTIMDDRPIGPAYRLRFAFELAAEKVVRNELAELVGEEIRFVREIEKGKPYWAVLAGFEGTADNYVCVENTETGARLEITGDRPPVKFNVFAARTAVCPEPFVEVKLAPGESMSWSNRYTFSVGD